MVCGKYNCGRFHKQSLSTGIGVFASCCEGKSDDQLSMIRKGFRAPALSMGGLLGLNSIAISILFGIYGCFLLSICVLLTKIKHSSTSNVESIATVTPLFHRHPLSIRTARQRRLFARPIIPVGGTGPVSKGTASAVTRIAASCVRCLRNRVHAYASIA